MTTELFWSQGKATLNAGITSSQTTCAFTLASGSQAPPSTASGQFVMSIDNENVEVTAMTGPVGNVYTVTAMTRSVGGSTAATHSTNAPIYGVVTQTAATALILQTVGAPTDNTYALGTSSLRFANLVTNKTQIFATAGDANPVFQYSSAGVVLGAGGSTAVDVGVNRASAGTLAITNGSSIASATVAAGTDNTQALGTTALRFTNVYAAGTYYAYTSSTDNLAITHTGLTFAAGTASPSISQATQTSDTACNSITLTPQAPYASASTNVVGGSVSVALSAPISGTSEAAFKIVRAGTTICQIQTYPGNSAYTALYLVPGVTIATNTESINAGSSSLTLNHSASVYLAVGGNTILQAAITGVTLAYPSLSWAAGVAAPVITQAAPAAVSSGNGTAATTLALTGQSGGATSAASATGGAGSTVTVSGGAGGNATGTTATGGAAGNLVLAALAGGTGTSTAGATGSVQISLAGTVLAQWTPNGPIETPYAWSMGITTGTATLTSAQYIYPVISVATATLTGALTIVFPSTVGGIWSLDLSKVTFSSYAITVKCGTGAAATTITSSSVKTLWTVVCPAANVCVIG